MEKLKSWFKESIVSPISNFFEIPVIKSIMRIIEVIGACISTANAILAFFLYFEYPHHNSLYKFRLVATNSSDLTIQTNVSLADLVYPSYPSTTVYTSYSNYTYQHRPRTSITFLSEGNVYTYLNSPLEDNIKIYYISAYPQSISYVNLSNCNSFQYNQYGDFLSQLNLCDDYSLIFLCLSLYIIKKFDSVCKNKKLDLLDQLVIYLFYCYSIAPQYFVEFFQLNECYQSKYTIQKFSDFMIGLLVLFFYFLVANLIIFGFYFYEKKKGNLSSEGLKKMLRFLKITSRGLMIFAVLCFYIIFFIQFRPFTLKWNWGVNLAVDLLVSLKKIVETSVDVGELAISTHREVNDLRKKKYEEVQPGSRV